MWDTDTFRLPDWRLIVRASWRRQRLARLLLSKLLLLSAAMGCWAAQGPGQEVQKAYKAARERVPQLQKAGQFGDAIGVAEGFLRQHLDSGTCCRGMAVLVEGILSRDLTDLQKRHEVYDRAFTQFDSAPEYYALGAAGLVRECLWGTGGQARDPAKAAQLADEAIDKLGDRLPRDYYLGFNLYLLKVHALRYAKDGQAALAAASDCVLLAPAMLGNKDFLKALYEAARFTKDPHTQLSVAKLCYVLSDFTEAEVNQATEWVSAALVAAQGPGAALQFAKSQDDPETASPLKEVPLLELGDPDKLLEAAGAGDRDARISVFLGTGQTAKALTEATEQMRQSAGAAPQYLADALRNLARCFKAHDLNLIRANQFLEFHRTGAGVNPLPELEGELANAVTP